jgi:hypothetical protein
MARVGPQRHSEKKSIYLVLLYFKSPQQNTLTLKTSHFNSLPYTQPVQKFESNINNTDNQVDATITVY